MKKALLVGITVSSTNPTGKYSRFSEETIGMKSFLCSSPLRSRNWCGRAASLLTAASSVSNRSLRTESIRPNTEGNFSAAAKLSSSSHKQ